MAEQPALAADRQNTDRQDKDRYRRGRPKRAEEGDARQRIMAAAERLFAEKGLHGVALREIARTANLNPNLVSYYFPNKEALYCEIVDARGTWINTRREAMLAAVEERYAPALPPVDVIFHCLFRPIFQMRATEPDAWSLLCNMMLKESGSELYRELASRNIGPIIRRFTVVLHRALPAARRGDIVFLLEMSINAALLASPFQARAILEESMAAEWSDDEVEARLVRAATAIACDLVRQK